MISIIENSAITQPSFASGMFTFGLCLLEENRENYTHVFVWYKEQKKAGDEHEEKEEEENEGETERRSLGKLSFESGPGIVAPCGGSRGTDYFRVKTNLARRSATRGSREAELSWAEPSRAESSRGSLECRLTYAHDDEGGAGSPRDSRGEANGICVAIFRGLVPKRSCSWLWQHSVRSGHPGWQGSEVARGNLPGSSLDDRRPSAQECTPGVLRRDDFPGIEPRV